MKRLLGSASILLFSFSGYAGTLNLQNVTADDYGKIVDELSADFMHTSVSGASALGHVFGFEIGVVGGVTKTPEINRIVHDSDPSLSVNSLPAAELLGVVTVPAGVTIELGVIPKVGSSDFHFNSLSLAGKWTANEVVELPLSLAVKGQVTTAQFSSQASIQSGVSTVDTTYKYKSTITAFTLLASKDFAIVEPYAGLGMVSSTGNMDVTGVAAFDPSFTGSQSASVKRSSTQFLAGAELKLLVVKLGAEYAHLFGTNRFTGKLSFYF